MKARTKKALSLILASVMLLAMIPVGIVSVSAIDAVDGVYTINNLDDWNAIAAMSSNFEGMTVKLGDNVVIDGGNAAISTLFPGIFKGTFDGNADGGAKIQNATATTALIAIKTEGDAVVQNVNVSNVTLDANTTGCGLAIGWVNAGTATVKDMTVTDCKVNVGTKGVASATVIGYAPNGTISISNVDVTNVTITAGGATGVSGVMAWTSAATVVTIDDVTVSGVMLLPALTANEKLAGVIAVSDAVLTITNTHVDLDVTDTSAATTTTSAKYGGIFSYHNTNDAVISDCTVQGTINGGKGLGAIGGIGAVHGSASQALEVSNVTVDVDITSDMTSRGTIGTSNNHYDNGNTVYAVAGGIVSVSSYKEVSSIVFDNVKVTGDIKAANVSVGGLLGLNTWSDNKTTYTNVTVKNCEVTPTITVTDGSLAVATAGMIVGAWGEGNGVTSTGACTSAGALTIQNTVIGGKIIANTDNYYVGGAVGFVGFKSANVNVNQCLITTDMSETNLEGTNRVAGVIVGKDFATDGALNVNCTTTQTGNALGATGAAALSSSLVVVSTDDAAKMVEKNNKGEIVAVYGAVTGGLLQYTDVYEDEEGNDRYAVRFIAVSQLNEAANAGITIVVKDADGEIVDTFDTTECELYDVLKGYSPADGETLTDFSVADYGCGEKFMAVIIPNIPTGTAYSFEVTPHFTTEDGATINGVTEIAYFDAEGNLTNKIG